MKVFSNITENVTNPGTLQTLVERGGGSRSTAGGLGFCQVPRESIDAEPWGEN